jgi:hypothetical protein
MVNSLDDKALSAANSNLGQGKSPKMKVLFWVILGVIAGIVLIGVSVLVYILFFSSSGGGNGGGGGGLGSDYPYILRPRNTIGARSVPELLAAVALDANESAADYNVYMQSRGGQR